MDTERLWLNSLGWERVRTINHSLCQQQTTDFSTNGKTHDAARDIWEKTAAQQLSLHEALDLCRRCYEMRPFTFNNGNTFAAIAISLVEDWLKTLTAVEAQVIRNTVGHYAAGLIDRRELLVVLQHFQASWKNYSATRQQVEPSPASQGLPAVS